MKSIEMPFHPLGALSTLLFCCIVGLLTEKSDSTEYDYRGRREDTSKIGELKKSYSQTSSFAIYLPLTVPDDGILYKLRVFLVSTDPVFLQLWRPSGDRRKSFTLVDQIKVQSTRANVTRTLYPVIVDRDGSPQCPIVRENDRLGIFGTSGRLAVPIYFDLDRRSTLAKRSYDSRPMDTGVTLQFSDIIFPYSFSVEAFVYKDDSRSQTATGYRPCPLKLMPDYVTKTYTTSTETKHVTFPVSPHTESTTETVHSPTAAEDKGTNSADVLHIAVGSLAGVAVIAIIGVVVLALYCRRQHRSEGLKPVAGGATADNKPVCTPTAPTQNPAYGINCDFLNEYETPRAVRPQPSASEAYRPMVPPRPSAPEVENRNSGTYEEIKEAGSKRNGKRETAANGGDHVTGAGPDYEVYETPVYESLRPEVPKRKPIEMSDVVVLDGANAGPEPEVGSGEERGGKEAYDYLDLVPETNSSTYVL